MAIGAVPPTGTTPVRPYTPPTRTAAPTEGGFGDAIARGLQEVSGLEQQADSAALDIASGGSTGVHELMTATAKAQLGVQLLVQTRNRAVEAYQEIMRLQV